MLRGLLIYTGFLLVLWLSGTYQKLELLPLIYMLLPILFVPEEKLGLRNYRRGLLYGSFLIPLFVLFPPDTSCPAWLLNQLGIATAEEIFFRGFLMGLFGNLTTSVLFSLAHLINSPTLNSLLTFFPSLLFGWAYAKSGSIMAPVLLHFSANLLYFSLVKEFPKLYQLLQRQLPWS